ncbi:hypothetical protein HK102_010351, partial [Quaeritorhiza haematococci]
WFELFMEYFLETHLEGNDDLLFFVRQYHHALLDQDQDPIFVRRKVNNIMPSLNDVVCWKQTFFLNLIVQLPCTLTVAVCKRGSPPSSSPNASAGTAGNGEARTSSSPSQHDSSSSSETTTTTTPQKPKSRMLALRRITKKVYAAPYKSRMDVKDAFMNECSYPLVYYTIPDYESHDLHLPIREKEYLCVELSVTIPDPHTKSSPPATSPTEAVASVSLQDDQTPFPVPRGYKKIVLFQGAVPFSSLLDIYMQKGLAAQNQMRLSWNKLSTHSSSHTSNRSSFHGGGGGGGGGAD